MEKQKAAELTRWLIQQADPAKGWIRLTILCGWLQAVALVGQAALLAYVLSAFIVAQAAPEALWPQFVALAVVMVFKAGLASIKERTAFASGQVVRQHVRTRLLDQCSQQGPQVLQQRPAGSWASLLFEQVEQLQDFYGRYLPQQKIAAFVPLTLLCVVFPLNWAAGLILLLTAPLIPLFMIMIGKQTASASQKNFTALSHLAGYFLDRLRGLTTLQLLNQTAAEGEKLAQSSNDLRLRTLEVLRVAFLNSAVLEFFSAVSVAIVAVYFGFSYLGELSFGQALGVTDGKINLFTGLFILFLAPEFYAPLRELGTHYHAKAQAMGAADALVEFLHKTAVVAPCVSAPQPLQAFAGDTVTVEAVDLLVLGPAHQTLVGPLSFTLAAGSKTAIVGLSGAGKTSLMQALLGFAPYQGSLLINGIELRDMDLASWRAHLGWLGQQPALCQGTVRYNLQLQQPFPDASLIAALQQANAWDFMADKGLDYVLGDNNGGLSGGQAQRLALARCLLKPAPLLLLDEPTASVDVLCEQAIWQSLQAFWQDKTLLLITHRPEQLAVMDQILVLKDGQLLAQGDMMTVKASLEMMHA